MPSPPSLHPPRQEIGNLHLFALKRPPRRRAPASPSMQSRPCVTVLSNCTVDPVSKRLMCPPSGTPLPAPAQLPLRISPAGLGRRETLRQHERWNMRSSKANHAKTPIATHAPYRSAPSGRVPEYGPASDFPCAVIATRHGNRGRVTQPPGRPGELVAFGARLALEKGMQITHIDSR